MAQHPAFVPPRTLVLVGLMGAGKTSIGKRLAAKLHLPFVDADHEIESAAGCTIQEIFDRFGEAQFRDGERRVIARLLEGQVRVLSTGGGAFMHPETRALIRERGLSVWLRAPLDLLVARTGRRDNRPLLKQGNPRDILAALMAQRYPVYAEADITVDSDERPPEETAERVLAALRHHLAAAAVPADGAVQTDGRGRDA
ncbi:shikimate kinase [Rhodospirillum centenum]|uniref:Shikimate kinase n=1 Tax=Rhodospirillum centenum (strain ATCC 51521 / SW) TaxID=414684 RepID=B6IUW9_RHOCS|nr:shikimate kinase [Rhodospirillum centenum]ACJ00051.1 shikimate kinase [Rhodospirillum centenum SW]